MNGEEAMYWTPNIRAIANDDNDLVDQGELYSFGYERSGTLAFRNK